MEVGTDDAVAELPKCLEAIVDIFIASNTTARDTRLAIVLFTELSIGYEPSAATVSEMFASLYEAGYYAGATGTLEPSAFRQDASPLTEEARVFLFKLLRSQGVGPSALRVLVAFLADKSFLTENDGPVESSPPPTPVSIAIQNNAGGFNNEAAAALSSSSGPFQQRQALGLALAL